MHRRARFRGDDLGLNCRPGSSSLTKEIGQFLFVRSWWRVRLLVRQLCISGSAPALQALVETHVFHLVLVSFGPS